MEKPKSIRVVSAIADKKQAILYLEDGGTLVLKQGDHRLGDLLDIIIPITVRGEVAVVDLTDFSIYSAFEHKTEGKTKFFRMAKKLVKGWFGTKDEEQPSAQQSNISEEGQEAIIAAAMGTPMTEDEVSEHGSAIDINDEVGDDEVVVAVVEDHETGEKAVIPGVQAIKPLIDHAVRTNSTTSVQNFLNRCAKFIARRQHSVDDLMRFLEKGDLPLAEDGSIIAYKMLRATDTEGVFVDCHSRKIRQRVGSYVCVNEGLVDLNRRNECSNGLHIARRGYLGSFSGDVCVLCKIDPEDVMVVPHRDPNKVRVKGYHIIGVMSPEAMAELRKNKPMTGDNEALEMVYNAIHGHHIGRIERVQVNGQYGSDVVTTKLRHDKKWGRDAFSHTGSDLKTAAALDDENNVTGSVDPREINKRVTDEHGKLRGTEPDVALTDEVEPEEEGDAVCNECGESVSAGEEICDECLDELTAPDEPDEPEPTPEPVPEEVVQAASGKTTKPTKAQQARALYEAGDMDALKDFKKKAKKGWQVLGFTDKEIKKITK